MVVPAKERNGFLGVAVKSILLPFHKRHIATLHSAEVLAL